jgi:hypothetical protein
MPVPRVEVVREKTSLVAVEVETLLSKLTGKLKVMAEGEVEVVTAKTLPAVVVLSPIEPVKRPMEVTPAPLQAEPVSVIKPLVSCKQLVPDFKPERVKVPRELMVVEPLTATLMNDWPEVEAMTKIGKVWVEAEATTYRLAPAGVEVLIIKLLTVLSHRKLADDCVLDAPLAKTTCPEVKEPESLLLKVVQSAVVNCPLLATLAFGRFMTKALVVVVMLKPVPAVPVETLLMLLMLPRPRVEVETKLGAAAPLDCRICPAVPAKVERNVVPS